MAKRGAEDQLTKDDVESGRGGRDDSDDENNMPRDAPKEVLATRQIRGMPKRKGASGTPTAAPQAPPFGFGQSSASAVPATSFAAPASSGFSFGSSATATASQKSAAPTQGFNFGAVAPAKTGASTGTSGGAFSGFSFGGASAAPTTASAPVKPTSNSTFSALETSSEQHKAGAPKTSSNPFASFAFSPASSTEADLPATTSSAAIANTTVPTATGAFGKASSTSTALAFGAPSAITAASEVIESSSSTVKSPASTATSQAKAEQPQEDQKEIEYLTSVRGLNESIVRALSVKIRDEPFVNLAAALESVKAEYNTYLEEIMKKAGKDRVGKVVQAKKRDATAMNDSPMETPPSKKVPEAPKPAFAMPAPPASSAGGFKLPAPSPTSSTTAVNGFKPSFGAFQSEAPNAALPAVGGFKLPAATSSSTETATPASGGFKPTLPSTSAPAKASPFAGFSFGSAAPVEKKTAKPIRTPIESASTESSAAFPTSASGTSSSSTTESSGDKRPSSRASIFAQSVIDEQAKEKAAEKEPPSTPAPGAKTSSIFAMKPTVKPAIGDSMVVPSPPTSAGASSFLFKAPATPSAAASTTPAALPKFSFNMGATAGSTATGAPGTPGTPGSPGMFSFAAKPRSASATFGFGTAKSDVGDKSTAKDAIGKTDASTTPSQPPTSAFSFGPSAPRVPTSQSLFSAPSAAAGTTDAPKPIFSFGPTSTFATPKAVETVADNSGANTDSEEAPADSGPQADLTSGAGEEDEETLWQGKTSVGAFGVWGEATTPGWGNFKVCIVKLNREKNPSEGAQPMRRIIARMDPTGAVVQNFSLRSLSDMAALTETSYKLTVAGADGIQQIAVRFGKKREGFDPVPSIEKLKSVIRSEREAMGLAALPSLK